VTPSETALNRYPLAGQSESRIRFAAVEAHTAAFGMGFTGIGVSFERGRGGFMSKQKAIAAIAAIGLSLGSASLSARDGAEGAALGSGQASYYAQKFAGRRTASGEAYSPGALTAAHRTAPFGSRVRVTHLGNGRSVIVRVNDRGPWTRGRVIDLSYAAAEKIGLHRSGTAQVKLTLLDQE
jgi:rare lipoprotein A